MSDKWKKTAGGSVSHIFWSLLKLDGNPVLLKIIASNFYKWQDLFVKHKICTNHFKIKIPNLPLKIWLIMEKFLSNRSHSKFNLPFCICAWESCKIIQHLYPLSKQSVKSWITRQEGTDVKQTDKSWQHYDKEAWISSHMLSKVGWNCLSFSKLQQLYCWSLGMDK